MCRLPCPELSSGRVRDRTSSLGGATWTSPVPTVPSVYPPKQEYAVSRLEMPRDGTRSTTSPGTGPPLPAFVLLVVSASEVCNCSPTSSFYPLPRLSHPRPCTRQSLPKRLLPVNAVLDLLLLCRYVSSSLHKVILGSGTPVALPVFVSTAPTGSDCLSGGRVDRGRPGSCVSCETG